MPCRWTSFERAEGCLIKPDTACIDIGRFTVDAAYEAAKERPRNDNPVRIGEKPLADKTVEEIRGQASYVLSNDRGLLGTLALGVVGALIGGIAASALGTGDIFELNVLGFVIAVVAAVLLIGVAEGMSSKGKKTRV